MQKISRSNKIINEIMANASPAAILLARSDGESIGFLSKLSNFYKHTYWFNAEYDNVHSFSVEIARQVFAGDEETLKKIIQFKHCEFEYNKDNIIINQALEKIASLSGDCLIVIDNLESLGEKFKYPLLELLLKNSPRNLKVVLVSEKFININYNIFSEQCPKLLDTHALGAEGSAHEFPEEEEFTHEQRAFLCYISLCRHADRAFCEKILPGASYLLDYLDKKYRGMVFCKGNDLFYFNEKLHDYLFKKEPSLASSRFFDKDVRRLLCGHLLETGRPVKALELAVGLADCELTDGIIDGFVEEGKYMFMLHEFAASNNDAEAMLTDGAEKYPAIKFLIALCRFYRQDYKGAASAAEEVIAVSGRDTPREYEGHFIKFKCMMASGQYRAAVDYGRALLKSRVLEGDERNIGYLESILCLLPEAIKMSDTGINTVSFKTYESILVRKENKDKYWYAKALQSVAEIYFEWGNYNKAIAVINEIRTILPFYVIPYKLMDFYYYIGDMRFAYATAQRALKDAMTHNIDADLADVYTLLAKTGMYFNQQQEALSYIESAVACRNSKESSKYFAITVRSIICAKTGRAEYGRDIATIYAKYCELNSVKHGFYLYGAIAYCCKKLGDCEQALYYAKKCVAKANSRSGVWLLASAISVSILLESDELRDARAIVEKILHSSANYGMMTVVVDYYDCFENILKYAKERGIGVEYIKEVEERLAEKNRLLTVDNSVRVKFMGVSSVTVDGTEIQWKTRKAKELFLMYVWMGESGLDRNFILSVLWSDYVYVSAINNLKTTNNIIRNTLSAAGVDFKLDYGNSKYKLNVRNISDDYSGFSSKLEEYDENAPLDVRLSALKEILNLYNGGFATEINQPYFRRHGEVLKERIMLSVAKLAETLVQAGELIEAKRLLNYSESADREGEYAPLYGEVENKLKEFYEKD